VVPVSPRGRVPRFCADHTAADLPATDEPAASDDAVLADVEVVSSPEVDPDDGWPQQVAPLVWLGPNGERWTDLGEAERAVADWRKGGQ